MSDKKTIQEALAEVQRNAELKRIEEAKAVWGESLNLNEFNFPKFKTPKFEPKPTKPMPHGGEKLTPETPKGKRGPEEINIKPDTSTGKTKIEPAKPAEAPKTGGLGSKILGFGLGAALGTVVGDKLANKMKDAEPSAAMNAPSEPEKPKDSPKSDDMTFGQAFAAARKAATEKGAKSTGQFSWHGKDYQTNIQGKGTPKAPEEKYVAPSKQTKVDIGTKASAPPAKPETPSTQTPPADSIANTPTISKPASPTTSDFFDPTPTAQKKPETESGGKKKKMSEEINPMIAAFLKLQESNPQNMFEAAKKAKAKTRTEDGYGYDRYGNLKNPEDRYDDNNERIVPQNRRDSSSDEANDIIKGSAPMQGLRKSGGYDAGEVNDPGGRRSNEINDIIRGGAPIKGLRHSGGYDAGEVNDPGGRRSNEINDIIRGGAPIKGLRHSGGYDAGEVNDPGGRRSNEINDIIRGAAPIKGLQRSGGYNGSDASSEKSSGNGSEGRSSASWPPPKERPKNIPKDEYEYFPGMKKDPKGLSYRAVDEAKKTRTEDGAPIQGLRHSGGYDAGEVNDPGGRKSGEINSIIQGGAPIRGLHHSGGYDAVQRGEHLYKYNLRTGEKIPGGNAEMPAGWTPPASGKSNWDKSKEWEPTPTTDEKQAEKDRKWEALKKTLKPLPKDVPEEVEFSQAEFDQINEFGPLYSPRSNYQPTTDKGAPREKTDEWNPNVPGQKRVPTERALRKKASEKAWKEKRKAEKVSSNEEVEFSAEELAHIQSVADQINELDEARYNAGDYADDEVKARKEEPKKYGYDPDHGKEDKNDPAHREWDKPTSQGKARSNAILAAARRRSGLTSMKEDIELDEAGMPSSVIAQKQKLANMSDEEFAEKHGNKSEKELRDMAARHGYGWDKATKTGSDHYVNRVASIDMKEETLEEGRPKKPPTPETTERDPRKHIQVEAGRAAAGNVMDFYHNDGTRSKITPAMGRRITSHLNTLKPADRQAAVNKMHDSAEGLKV